MSWRYLVGGDRVSITPRLLPAAWLIANSRDNAERARRGRPPSCLGMVLRLELLAGSASSPLQFVGWNQLVPHGIAMFFDQRHTRR